MIVVRLDGTVEREPHRCWRQGDTLSPEEIDAHRGLCPECGTAPYAVTLPELSWPGIEHGLAFAENHLAVRGHHAAADDLARLRQPIVARMKARRSR